MLDDIKAYGGVGITESDSDLAAKCIFFTHQFSMQKMPHRNNKTQMDVYLESVGMSRPEAILYFLNSYYTFKKKGLPATIKERK